MNAFQSKIAWLALTVLGNGFEMAAQVAPPASSSDPGAKASVRDNGSALPSAAVYFGRVVHVGTAGAIVECAQLPSGAPGHGPALEQSRFYLRGAPDSLSPAAEIRFQATGDGFHRYADFFNVPVTMPALRFVKWDRASPAAPVPPSTSAQAPRTQTGSATAIVGPKAANKDPTPRLQGTMLDTPGRRPGALLLDVPTRRLDRAVR